MGDWAPGHRPRRRCGATVAVSGAISAAVRGSEAVGSSLIGSAYPEAINRFAKVSSTLTISPGLAVRFGPAIVLRTVCASFYFSLFRRLITGRIGEPDHELFAAAARFLRRASPGRKPLRGPGRRRF